MHAGVMLKPQNVVHYQTVVEQQTHVLLNNKKQVGNPYLVSMLSINI